MAESILGALAEAPLGDVFEEDNVLPVADGIMAAVEEGTDFFDNLAETLPPSEVEVISDALVGGVKRDLQARRPWVDQQKRGLILTGIGDVAKRGDDSWGTRVVHPMLAEAALQFASRAGAELFPPAGPAKGDVVGEETEGIREQADRVAEYQNYLLTEEMDAREVHEQVLAALPIQGSYFVKVWWDSVTEAPDICGVPAADFVVPYGAQSLKRCPRYTHIMRLHRSEVEDRIGSGEYRRIDLDGLLVAGTEEETVLEEADEMVGRERPGDDDDAASIVEIWEVHADLSIDGDHTGGDLAPYVVTLLPSNGAVLAIRRNWAEDDARQRKGVWFVHYKFLPGDGFYGYGFPHCIGGLSEAATGAMRALLDAAASQNGVRGFISNSVNGEMLHTPKPGEWVQTKMSSDDLRKAFVPIPEGGPSPSLMTLLGALVDQAQRFAGTTEAMVGDSDARAPVGTTLALIEQGSKVYTAIHGRLHRSMGLMLRHLARLIGAYAQPGEPYPYRVAVPRGGLPPTPYYDFDDRVDVIPVSDPKIFSNTQRIALAQATLQLATQFPDLFDRRAAVEDVLRAMGQDRIADLMPDRDQDPPHADPVSEDQMLLLGRPIRAYADQDHMAHIAVHEAFMQGLPPKIGEGLGSKMMAHIAEHLAYQHRVQMQAQLGVALPAPDLHAEPGDPIMPDLPPMVDAAISRGAAQAAQVMTQKQKPQGPPPEVQKALAEIEAIRAKTERENGLAQAKMKEADARIREIMSGIDIDKAEAMADAALTSAKTQQTRAATELADIEAASRVMG